ncbi:MAG TPA: serine/threonine-protein kinase [Vicinamibacterales bacterium]|nr:serine/threonine-protein kinase [Vicinamibacterales bacterium]
MTQIIGLSRPERVRTLEADFPDDSAFRDEILSLLDVYDLAAAQFGQSSSPTKSADEPEELLKAGAAYGPYRVLKQLGAGGMGQVVLAEDIRLGRRVALKSLTGKWLQSPAARRRLMREARAVAALAHPNIATLYDVFEDESRLLLVMEYVEGKTLASLISEGPIAVGHAVRLAAQVSDAVSYAHDHGVIHCDLKPANIQVSDEGTAKVLDFGLARIKYAQEDADEPVTTPGAVLGTPGYVAPERLLAGVSNASCDIYSLGVVLFEMVTGRRLLEGEEPDRWFDILSAGPPKASSLIADVPAGLDDAIERALSIDPALRYQSVREFRRDLKAILSSVDTSSSVAITADADGRQAEPARPSDPGILARSPAAAATSPVLFTVQLLGSALLVVTFTGYLTSAQYDWGLARSVEFGAASPLMWPVWGFRALFVTAVVAAGAVIGVGVMISVVQAIFAMVVPLTGPPSAVRLRYVKLRERLESISSAAIAQTLLIVHVVVFAGLWWRFQPLIAGLIGFMLVRPVDLSILSPDRVAEHRLYRELFSVALVVFSAAWYGVLRLRRRRGDRQDTTTIAGGLALTGLTLLLFAAPYRILTHNEGEPAVYGRQECSLVGEHGDEGLLFCPRQPPPWNKIVRLDDADLHRGRTQESIFTPLRPKPAKEH